MSAETNKAIVRRYYEEVLNQQNLSLIEELFAPDFHSHARTKDMDLPTYTQTVERSLQAFPDLQVTIEAQIGEGDLVATRWRATGTHQGLFGGIAPTGREITLTAMHFHRIVDGKISDHWEQFDFAGAIQQLGVLSQVNTQRRSRT